MIVVETSDASKAGDYYISYTISLVKYSTVSTVTFFDALIVTVIDLCAATGSL